MRRYVKKVVTSCFCLQIQMQPFWKRQCSHQNVQVKEHRQYLMTTLLNLNVVIATTKRLLHVYQRQQSILVEFSVH